MESGAKGCEVVVSGKLRAARAKSMKFTDGEPNSTHFDMNGTNNPPRVHDPLRSTRA